MHKFMPALSSSPLKGFSDPLHCPFLLPSACTHVDKIQQGLKPDAVTKDFPVCEGGLGPGGRM